MKSHSANTETFVSPFWGPLGYVDPDRVVFRRNTLGRQSIRPPELVEDVHLIKLGERLGFAADRFSGGAERQRARA